MRRLPRTDPRHSSWQPGRCRSPNKTIEVSADIEALFTQWRASEAKLYPMVVVSPHQYEANLRLVRAMTDVFDTPNPHIRGLVSIYLGSLLSQERR